jgi:hypothetical protein
VPWLAYTVLCHPRLVGNTKKDMSSQEYFSPSPNITPSIDIAFSDIEDPILEMLMLWHANMQIPSTIYSPQTIPAAAQRAGTHGTTRIRTRHSPFESEYSMNSFGSPRRRT